VAFAPRKHSASPPAGSAHKRRLNPIRDLASILPHASPAPVTLSTNYDSCPRVTRRADWRTRPREVNENDTVYPS